jgi:hypothetical protein
MFQIPHGMGGYVMTPNVIPQISTKVVKSKCTSLASTQTGIEKARRRFPL